MEGDILERELDYHKKLALKIQDNVKPVSRETIERYSECRNWRYFEKEAVFYHIGKFLGDRKNVTVCELGCGEGLYSCQVALVYPDVKVIGIDISPDLISVASKNAEINDISDRVSFVVGDAETTSEIKNKFDIILILNIIHHTDHLKILKQIDGLLKKNGLVIIQEPICYSKILGFLRSIIPVKKDVSPDERQLDKQEVNDIVKAYNVEHMYYYNLFGRLYRFIPESRYRLAMLKYLNLFDAVVFKLFPYTKNYAGRILIVATNT